MDTYIKEEFNSELERALDKAQDARLILEELYIPEGAEVSTLEDAIYNLEQAEEAIESQKID